LCIPSQLNPNRCEKPNIVTPEAAAHFKQCENADLKGGLDYLCYYHRINHICKGEILIQDYQNLFASDVANISQVQREMARAFGDSLAWADPTSADLLEAAAASAAAPPPSNLEERRDICDSGPFRSSLRIDDLAVSCVFALIEKA
jgi:hypothetical protein